MKEIKWAILMSGWGRSAVKTLELYEENKLEGHSIELVVYEKEENGVLEPAKKAGINTVHLPKASFENESMYYDELISYLRKHEIDYLFLLGYGHIIRDPFLSLYSDKIVNIHPSILPSFRGKKAIQQAMNYGVKVTGITTHLIDEELDRGKILCQRCIRIRDGESFDELDQRFVEEGKKIIEDTFNEILKNE